MVEDPHQFIFLQKVSEADGFGHQPHKFGQIYFVAVRNELFFQTVNGVLFHFSYQIVNS